MLRILGTEAMRRVEAVTIERQGVTSLDLMERAGKVCADWFLKRFPARTFLVLVGQGNNGGDGYVIARALKEGGCRVRVCEVPHRQQPSPDQAVNAQRWRSSGCEVLVVEDGSIGDVIAEHEVVIDALMGMGLDRPLEGVLKNVVMAINAHARFVVSIDLPSGMFAEDNSGNDPKGIVRAHRVLTLGLPKLALLLPENEAFVGYWDCLDIGLDAEAIRTESATYQLMDETDVTELMPERRRFDHKGRNGHALLIAGRQGMAGAAVLAASAARRSGCGLVTVHVPSDLATLIHLAAPECLVSLDRDPMLITEFPHKVNCSALGIGPGLGTKAETATVLKRSIVDAGVPLLIDADGLNLLAENPTWLAFLPKNSILTPHPGEFDRLGRRSTSGHERLQRARAFAQRFQVVVVLKGAFTAICGPDGDVVFNPKGSPGMAKGGSGDVLTGIITGLLAQGIAPFSAAMLGAYAHGLAGELAGGDVGIDGMVATDIIDRLPLAWKRIRGLA